MRQMRRNQKKRKIVVKPCQFCLDKTEPDYKNPDKLRPYLQKNGKISARKYTGTCAKHQRRLTQAVKRARFLALLPYVQTVK